MVQIGTIEYEAKVSGVADAKKQANDLADSQREVAATSEQSAAATGLLAGKIGSLTSNESEAGRETDRTKSKVDLLSSAMFFLTSRTVAATAAIIPFTGVLAKASGALGTVYAWLAAGGISGVLSAVIGKLSAFASWLLAGSAGALAVAAGIGAAIGVFAVWLLQITGVLDKIGELAVWVGEILPAWAVDGILALIGFYLGPLAALGAFITGTLEGGFSEGFARAEQVLSIFTGSFERTFGRIKSFVMGVIDDVVVGIEGLASDAERLIGDVGDAVVGGVRTAFNTVVPDEVSLPSTTLSAPDWAGGYSYTIGGQSLDLPQLQTGGMIRDSGIAQVHQGEAVIPEPIVDAARSGGSGGDTVVIDEVSVKIEAGDFDPSNMSRRELESFAEDVAEMVGKETSRRAGVR